MLKKIVVFSHIRSQARAGQCRHQNYFFRLMSGAAFLVFIPLALLSCSLMNTDLKEYLCEYTEDAAVMTYEFGATYPSDSSGTVCLPSGAARTVTLKLRNPQHYTIDCGYSFPSAASSAAAALSAGGVAPVTYAQGTDTTLITATFSDELLTAMEKGGDVSLTVSLTEHVSQRSFTSYTVPVHANTPPPEADGAMVCIDTNASPNTYVLCFNMPSTAKMGSSGIHGDITSLAINDTSYPLTVDSATGTFSFTGSPAALSQTAPAGLAANSTSGNGYTFTPRNQPVYFSTGDAVSTDNKSYTIAVTDAAGLSSSVTVSVQSVKLGTIYMKDCDGNVVAAGANIPQDSDGSYSTVTLCPPDTSTDVSGSAQDTSDAKVIYQVYKGTDTSGTLIMDGETTSGSATLKLPVGPIYIVACARKALWADSPEFANSYKVLAATAADVSGVTQGNPVDYTLRPSSYGIPAGGTLSLNIITVSDGSAVTAPTSATITLYQNGSSLAGLGDGIGTKTTAGSLPSITIPTWLVSGNYQLYLQATVGGKTYSATTTIQIYESGKTIAEVTDETTLNTAITTAVAAGSEATVYLTKDIVVTKQMTTNMTAWNCTFSLIVPTGQTVTITRDSSYTGPIFSCSVGYLSLGNESSGTLIIDGGAPDITNPAIIAQAPLVQGTSGGGEIKLYNVTLQNNYNGSESNYGGALSMGRRYKFMYIYHCVIQNCYSTYGGAIYRKANYTIQLIHTSITACKAGKYGGGLYLSSGVYATYLNNGSSITNCFAGDLGGGIYLYAPVQLEYSGASLSGNTDKNGNSQIYIAGSSLRKYTSSSAYTDITTVGELTDTISVP